MDSHKLSSDLHVCAVHAHPPNIPEMSVLEYARCSDGFVYLIRCMEDLLVSSKVNVIRGRSLYRPLHAFCEAWDFVLYEGLKLFCLACFGLQL